MAVNEVRNVPRLLRASRAGLSDVSGRGVRPRIRDGIVDLERVISNTERMVGVTGFGKQLNEMYSQLKETQDPAEREAALSGMRTVVSLISQGPDPMIMADFVLSAEGLGGMDSDALREFFSTAQSIDSIGFDVGKWVGAFLQVGQPLRQRVTEQAQQALQSPEQGRANLTKYVDAIEDIVESEGDIEERMNMLSRFVGGAAEIYDPKEKASFIQSFVAENL